MTIYTGTTSDLKKRVYQHKTKPVVRYTSKYDVNQLVHYEETNEVVSAIAREKQIKAWRRRKKVELIISGNPKWKDLCKDWFEDV
ncbi:MAG: GIY-YIG nuclease family protein [Chloroflexi bacterium]|nr:GIY-YIG nuclease family protein [Chloroflexota bacterium]